MTRRAYTHGIAQQRFLIPPGAANHPVSSTFRVPTDVHVLSFMPHMHLRGKSFEYKATYPDGSSEVLLSVPAYDFGWQSYYTLAEPKAMPRGTRIDCLAHFDNSAENPANPDPSKAVIWGDQTLEEMMIGYIDYVEDAPIGSEAPAGTRAIGAEDSPSRPSLAAAPPPRRGGRPSEGSALTSNLTAFAGGPIERLHWAMPEGPCGSAPRDRRREVPMIRGVIAAVMVGALLGGHSAGAEEAAGSEVPAAFAPFEHMVGGWKGMGIPTANRLKGWPETHQWAWKFAGGKPVAMTVTTEGGKVFKQGQLSFDAASRRYRLEGTDPAGKPIAFLGVFDPAGQACRSTASGPRIPARTASSSAPTATSSGTRCGSTTRSRGPAVQSEDRGRPDQGGRSLRGRRLRLRPPQVHHHRRRSTMTVSYEGKSYPLCCSGCRDEFNDNPAKYVQKALLRARDGGEHPTKPASASVGQDDDAFDGLVDEPTPKARPLPEPATPRAKGKAVRPRPRAPQGCGPRGLAPSPGPEPRQAGQDRRRPIVLPASRQGLRRDPRGQDRRRPPRSDRWRQIESPVRLLISPSLGGEMVRRRPCSGQSGIQAAGARQVVQGGNPPVRSSTRNVSVAPPT